MGFAVTVGSQVLATNWAPFSPPPSLNRGWVKRQHEITSLLCNLVKSTSLTPPWGFDSALQCNNVLHSTCFVMLSRGFFKTMQEEDTEQQLYIFYCKVSCLLKYILSTVRCSKQKHTPYEDFHPIGILSSLLIHQNAVSCNLLHCLALSWCAAASLVLLEVRRGYS